MALRTALDRWFTVSEDDPLASARRAALLSRLNFALTAIVSTTLGLWLVVARIEPYLGAGLIGTAFIRFAGIALEMRGYPATGYVVASLTGSALYATAVLDIGVGAGLEVWGLILLGLPVLLMGPQLGRLRPTMFAVNAAVIAATEIAARLVPPRVEIPAAQMSMVRGANFVATAIILAVLVTAYRRMLDRAERHLAEERQVSERLLANILPGSIAVRLKRDENPIADMHEAVTVMFADMVNFTEFAAQQSADRVVNRLNRMFHAFDDMVERRGLEKIKTIGDAYMAAGGLPLPRDDHAGAVADLAFEMLDFVARISREEAQPIELRVGIHSGRLVAGVIGKHKFSYDLWGDTVNTAARLETAGAPGRVHISEATRRALGPGWAVEPRGRIALKGLGDVPSYFLIGRVPAEAAG